METFKVKSMFEPFFLLHQSLTTDAILVAVMSVVWILAMVAKYSIFKTIFNIGIWTRPINLLILVDQTINTIHRSCSCWLILLTLVLGHPMAHYFPPSFCTTYNYIKHFGTIYGAVGSCGISLFRLAYFKSSSVKWLIGPSNNIWW